MNRISRIIDEDRADGITFHITNDMGMCVAHATNVMDAIALQGFYAYMKDIPLCCVRIIATGQDAEDVNVSPLNYDFTEGQHDIGN